jgi:hypothetical protein
MENSVLAPNKAVDGNSGTRFGSAWKDGQWWQVDLGAVRTVSKVEIVWEDAYASSYKILTSKYGKSWSEAASVSLSGAATKVTTFAARNARYIRVVGVKRATQWGMSFWEARVYGLESPSPAAVNPAEEEDPPVEPPVEPPSDPPADPAPTDTGAGPGPASGDSDSATPPPAPGTAPKGTRGLRKRGASRCRRASRNRAKQAARSKSRCEKAKKRKAKRRS